MKSIDCSIIILTYNTKEMTVDCIRSVQRFATKPYTIECIVCDNGSTDGTEEYIKKHVRNITFIQNGNNQGFAAGNNVGIKQAKGRYVLLLNSDTIVSEHAISTMIAFMDMHPHAGASTCALKLSNGKLDQACHRGFPTPWAAVTYFSGLERMFPRSSIFGRYHMGYMDMTTPHEVDCISGAFFMTRREIINEVGLLDASFFMYGEDIDWSYRIKEKGWEIWFNPSVWIVHKKKQSGRGKLDRAVQKEAQKHFLDTMAQFYKKHYEKKYGWVLTQMIYVGIWVKRQLITVFGDS